MFSRESISDAFYCPPLRLKRGKKESEKKALNISVYV